ncbi:unnamed protein product, partial [marine sediment metagenome]
CVIRLPDPLPALTHLQKWGPGFVLVVGMVSVGLAGGAGRVIFHCYLVMPRCPALFGLARQTELPLRPCGRRAGAR